jgi:hypothetical protein
MNSEVYKRKMDTQDELLSRIMDATARVKKKVKINSDEQH